MIANYYTLRALVDEWRADLIGSVVADVFSQTRNELSMALASPENEWTLRASTQAPLYFLFLAEGHNRARRNVATLFEAAAGRAVTDVRIAERDRVIYVDLEGGLVVQIMLFGPRANVFLVDAGGVIREAFARDAELAGEPAPEARPAPAVASFGDFDARWRANRKTTEQALATALPLFDRTLASEVMHRAGVAKPAPSECTEGDRRKLFDAALAVRAELEHPVPRIYWQGGDPETFSLIPLHTKVNLQEEAFDGVNAAAAVFVRRTLARQSFRTAYEPLERALSEAAAHYRGSTERMLEELSKESRAGRYEHWGHLLMASAAGQPAGQAEITLPDLFADNTPVAIPLDPALSAVENARIYYDRARRTRLAHIHAEGRLEETEQKAHRSAALLDQVRQIDILRELERFKKDHADELARFTSPEAADADRIPFRRYHLEGGYEVWVGKNARQNEALTFQYAQKYDLWMHARGVPGSHAVLRLPHRQADPGRPLLERAASIAAYHSKARGSGLAPVTVAERKYVRKAKGAPPGAVIVERERVLIVEPRLPDE